MPRASWAPGKGVRAQGSRGTRKGPHQTRQALVSHLGVGLLGVSRSQSEQDDSGQSKGGAGDGVGRATGDVEDRDPWTWRLATGEKRGGRPGAVGTPGVGPPGEEHMGRWRFGQWAEKVAS